MSKKEVKFGQEGFNKVLRGVNILAKTVSSTLGPGGRNVIFENGIPNGELTYTVSGVNYKTTWQNGACVSITKA